MINKSLYGKLEDGANVYQYSLENKNGTKINLINYGAIITNIFLRDKNNQIKNIVLGYDSLDGYVNDSSFIGAIVGRYGNRIAKGRFKIDSIEYQLSINDGENHLHGGQKGFYKVLWDSEIVENNLKNSVKLSYISNDGEEGYPGKVNLSVIYNLTDDDELKIIYEGTTNKPTILNPTHHSYFNLSGNFNKTILDHYLQIDSSKFIPVNNEMIPTGKMEMVKGTPFDFQNLMPIDKRINDHNEQLNIANGYDHNFVLNNYDGKTRKAASLFDPSTGRLMEVYTNQPGLQFYSGNSLTGNANHKYRTGLCLEAQHFPDSPNHDLFPSTVLRPGEVYKQETIYKFIIK